jgi:alpha/beta superfamily hydrolase
VKSLFRFFSGSPRERDLAKGWQADQDGDYAKAAKEFMSLAERGNATAQFNLGGMYHDGRGVPQDDQKAVQWFRMAAEQEYADAQFNLGVMYALGKGVDQDYAEALRWYRMAADQGTAVAQFNLGAMYHNGHGTLPDENESVRWYHLAAEQGHADAQFKLGVMYATGEFDTEGAALMPSLIQAHLWCSLAAASGRVDSSKILEIVAREMSPDAIEQARRLAQEWKPKTSEESALDVYRGDVLAFFQALNRRPQNVSAKEVVELLGRADELIDHGHLLGEAAGDLVKNLRDVHHALTNALKEAAPEAGELQGKINSLGVILRAPALRQWSKRPK